MKRAITILLPALALAGCGGSGVKSAADDLVRGTSAEVTSAQRIGDDAGTAVVELDDGAKFRVDLVKEGGKFVFDACEHVEGTPSLADDCENFIKP